MKRKISAVILVMVLLFSMGSLSSFAAEDQTNIISDCTEYFDDGTYLVTEIAEQQNDSSDAALLSASSAKTKSAYKEYQYYSRTGVMQWRIVVHANFTYNGSSSSCTYVTHTRNIYKSEWSCTSQTSSRSGNSATSSATIIRKFLGIKVDTKYPRVTLSCSPTGVLS